MTTIDPPRASEHISLLKRLQSELSMVSVEAELCLVGGAVVILAFSADPATRRIGALFKPQGLVHAAAARVATREGLPLGWLNKAVRDLVGVGGLEAAFLDELNLRVFSARADYVLAMKCASLAYTEDPTDESDIRYLMRLLDLSEAEQVRNVALRYFSERQLPTDIDSRLTRIMR